MDKLRAMQIYVKIVETGSLTGAADSMGMSLPSVVRSLAALERLLGVRLIHRTTRRSSLSDEGRAYYDRCKRILNEVDEAEAAMSARHREPKGRLRVTAPVIFGRLHVAPVVAELLSRYRNLEVELLLLDRVVDLVEEGIDAAVRIGHLPDSTLVARPLGATHRVVCAAPAYLRSAGTPRRPTDLTTHRTVLFNGLSATDEWSFGAKPALRVAVRPVLRTNQLDAAIDACMRGLGCGQFLHYQVEGLIRAKQLKRVLAEFEPPPLPIQVVYPHARHLSTNVRAFMELAIARLHSRSVNP